MTEQIRSVSDDQDYIIRSIMELLNIKQFDADLTFGKGGFWKNLPRPMLAFDLDPQLDFVVKASSTKIPLPDAALRSIMFDPPFLTYIKQGREHNSIMGRQFSGYWTYDELTQHYSKTINESYRVLSNKGNLVIKCQDIIHNHSMHPTHINVLKWAEGLFRLKDLFILTAKHRLPMPEKENEKKRTQKHARVHHSYFMVLEKQ